MRERSQSAQCPPRCTNIMTPNQTWYASCQYVYRVCSSSLSFKVRAASHDCHTLIHDPFSNSQIIVDHSFQFLAIRDLLRVDTSNTVVSVSLDPCMVESAKPSCKRFTDGLTHVSPVLRLTPAKKAERRIASKAKWVRRPSLKKKNYVS